MRNFSVHWARFVVVCATVGGACAVAAQGLPILGVEVFSYPELRRYPITLRLSGPSNVDVKGRISADGSTRHGSDPMQEATPGPRCENGVDFIPLVNQPFTIPRGQLSTTLETEVCGDAVFESNEHFLVRVDRASLVGARCADGLANRCDHVPDILDDDAAADGLLSLRIFNVLVREPRTGTTQAELTVQLSRTAADPVTVAYHTVAGTASDRGRVAPPLARPSVAINDPDACSVLQRLPGLGLQRLAFTRDFLPRTGVLTIPAGSSRATISIPVCADPFAEGQEHFFVVLSNAEVAPPSGVVSGVGIARGRALVSIH